MFFPIATLSRLIVTGKDRAKYLHNFCTNNIKELQNGQSCEVFFCDVKARVIAHGYVLAFDECLEIWMVAGDEAGLLKHLNRYIITEDVSINSVTESTSVFAAFGTLSAQHLLSAVKAAETMIPEPHCCLRLTSIDTDTNGELPRTAFCVTWAETTMLWLATQNKSDVEALTAGADTNDSKFEHLRIRERFPIINQDMSSDNIVPEAARNTSAISYVKGCYLGQEPIARLDAMGHVNRSLQCVESTASAEQLLQAKVLTADEAIIGTVTSAANTKHGSVGLTLLRTNAVQGPLHCVFDGRNHPVRV